MTTINQIVDRMVETIEHILPDVEPAITFIEYEGDAQLGIAVLKGDPSSSTRLFSVVGDGSLTFAGFNGDLTQSQSTVVVIATYVCPGRGGFKRARGLMCADRDRICHEMASPTISGGFAAIGNPIIDATSSDMTQVDGTPQHVLTMTFRIDYNLVSNQ